VEKLRAALIGLGRINTEDHLPALLESEEAVLDSVCDIHAEKVQRVVREHAVEGFDSLDELLSRRKPDFAIVAIPHHAYPPVVEKLARANVHVLKEKPLATSLAEAQRIEQLVRETGIKLLVTLQRRYNPIFRAFEQLRTKIGRVFYFDSQYTLNIQDLENGWRSSKEKAGGGALIDMGYHSVDLLLWYFGLPKTVQAQLGYANREGQTYNVEDTCSATLDYGDQGNGARLFGNMLVSRVFPRKQEKLTVMGTRGAVEIERMRIARLDAAGATAEELTRSGEWRPAFIDQIDTFARWVRGSIDAVTPGFREHYNHAAVIEAAYLSDQRGERVSPAALLSSQQITL